jgi:hypothetical protein
VLLCCSCCLSFTRGQLAELPGSLRPRPLLACCPKEMRGRMMSHSWGSGRAPFSARTENHFHESE